MTLAQHTPQAAAKAKDGVVKSLSSLRVRITKRDMLYYAQKLLGNTENATGGAVGFSHLPAHESRGQSAVDMACNDEPENHAELLPSLPPDPETDEQ